MPIAGIFSQENRTAVPGYVRGRNSASLLNSKKFSPSRIETLDGLEIKKTVVEFDIVAREGQFTDTTIANYNFRGQGSSIGRYLLNEGSKRLPNFFKGELTTQFDGITPKTLNFDIIFRVDKGPRNEGAGLAADGDFSHKAMMKKIIALQSLCYPRFAIGANPPLCNLFIAGLYSLEVFVQQVLVSWHNTWDLEAGLPNGCDISMAVLMHQYPTRDEILKGAGFNSLPFTGNGYSGTFESGVPSTPSASSFASSFGDSEFDSLVDPTG
jgi:hypothetical protein